MQEQIKELLAVRGPVELSVLYHEIPNDDAIKVIICAFDMSRRGELWWIDVHGDHAIVGLPDQPKPADPLSYLGLVEIHSAEGSIVAPSDFVKKYGLPVADVD